MSKLSQFEEVKNTESGETTLLEVLEKANPPKTYPKDKEITIRMNYTWGRVDNETTEWKDIIIQAPNTITVKEAWNKLIEEYEKDFTNGIARDYFYEGVNVIEKEEIEFIFGT